MIPFTWNSSEGKTLATESKYLWLTWGELKGSMKERFSLKETPYIMTMVVVTWLYAFLKTHLSKISDFIGCKLYLDRAD